MVDINEIQSNLELYSRNEKDIYYQANQAITFLLFEIERLNKILDIKGEIK